MQVYTGSLLSNVLIKASFPKSIQQKAHCSYTEYSSIYEIAINSVPGSLYWMCYINSVKSKHCLQDYTEKSWWFTMVLRDGRDWA